MAWVPDSRTAGYLGPAAEPEPLEDDAWQDFLHDVFAGITGLPNDLVRPRWQPEPPNQPEISTDWMAFGPTDALGQWRPSVTHFPGTAGSNGSPSSPDGDGYDLLQDHETTTILCVFYGPNAERTAGLVRNGLRVFQNRAALESNGIAVVEVGANTKVPELFKMQWLGRVDVNIILRREIRRVYPVLNILRAQGTVKGNNPGTGVVESHFDTDLEE